MPYGFVEYAVRAYPPHGMLRGEKSVLYSCGNLKSTISLNLESVRGRILEAALSYKPFPFC